MKNTKETVKGITLIALVITIILLLILSGIVITQLTSSGLFGKAKRAKIISDYTTAKERIELELMTIHTDCTLQGIEYDIIQIEIGMEKPEDITIENIYYSSTAKLKNGIELDINKQSDLIGVLVSVNQYSQYKFLIGKSKKIEKAVQDEIPEKIDSKDLKPIDEFERDIIGLKPGTNDNKEDEKEREETIDVPGVGQDIDTSNPIEITTYISIKSNSKNTLNLTGVENTSYVVQEKTNNVNLSGNILTANNNADSNDSCKIQINGTYSGQSYINNLIVYVEPKNTVTIAGDDYYRIYTAQDLVRLSELTNHNIGSIKNAIMMNDIDLEGIDWIPMGKYFLNKDNYLSFKGIFDGQNYIIKNMKINVSSTDNITYVGFIGGLEKRTVKNIKFENPDVYSEKSPTGIVVGNLYSDSIIENVEVIDGKIETITSQIGGICGYSEKHKGEKGSIIKKCSNNATIISSGNGIGGIAGTTDNSTIENCYNTGTVISKGGVHIGGICGMATSNATIKNCYSSGTINTEDGHSQLSLGGIVGLIEQNSKVEYCYNKGKVLNNTEFMMTGGIAGYLSAYENSSVEEKNASTIENCYNAGDIESNGTIVGGIIGFANKLCKAQNCWTLDSINITYKSNPIGKSEEYGSEPSYVGRVIGKSEISEINIGQTDKIPTVYDVLNEFNEEESTIWSNSNPNHPQLLSKKEQH